MKITTHLHVVLRSRMVELYEVCPQNKSVCKYCHCIAVVTMVCMLAEFVGPLGRNRHHLQTIELRLNIVLCVYNVQEN
jgi:hypothetical protein